MIPILPRGLLLAGVAAAAATALGGCAPLIVGTAVVGTAMVATDRRTTGAQLEDEVILGKAKNRIQEALGDRGQLVVTTFNRVVLLTGEVPDAADKAKAEQAVKTVENVQSVVNEITIGFPRSPTAVCRRTAASSRRRDRCRTRPPRARPSAPRTAIPCRRANGR